MMVKEILNITDNIVVQSSCSLQHCPYDLNLETNIDECLKGKLSFAVQKLQDIFDVANMTKVENLFEKDIQSNIENELKPDMFKRSEYNIRKNKQIKLPDFPTTAIGS